MNNQQSSLDGRPIGMAVFGTALDDTRFKFLTRPGRLSTAIVVPPSANDLPGIFLAQLSQFHLLFAENLLTTVSSLDGTFSYADVTFLSIRSSSIAWLEYLNGPIPSKPCISVSTLHLSQVCRILYT